MTAIVHVHAREILDSRGNPTVEVDVLLANGILGGIGGLFGYPDVTLAEARELADKWRKIAKTGKVAISREM